MCGRYAATKSADTLAEEFEAEDGTAGEVREDYNVAPTKQVAVVRERAGEDEAVHRRLELMRWGLVPSWAKDPSIGNRMINARIESVASKAAFRRAAARRRCLVPADGWYEWAPPAAGHRAKQPYYMTRPDGRSLAFAGLYELWRPPDATEQTPWLVTVSIITEPAVGVLADIHDRMPYVLPPEQWERWLDPGITTLSEVAELLVPTPEGYVAELEVRPVSTAVNNVRNNGPDLLAPVPAGSARSAASTTSGAAEEHTPGVLPGT